MKDKIQKYDCIVCGGGPSGFACALAAKRNHAKVLLIEDSGVFGGANILSLVGPLMSFHQHHKQVIGGIASEIVDRLQQRNASLGHIADPLGFCETVTPVDSESLKALYFELAKEENLEYLLHSKIVGVKKKNREITSLVIANKEGLQEVSAKVYVDATGDGDIAYFAGCEYLLGRDEDHLCQPMTMPFVVGNIDFDAIRAEMKKDPNNFVLDPTYDFRYIGVSGFFKEVELAKKNHEFDIERDRVLLFQNVNPKEATINMTRIPLKSSVNALELTQAEAEGRRQVQVVFQFLKKYIPGFENAKLVMTPSQIGVRESRHILCDYVLTKEDVLTHRHFEDSCVIGTFPMDIHAPVGDNLELTDQGSNLAYEIPVRSLIAKDLDNLLITGRAIGATHEASASARVTPVVMALGEAAGVLASLASTSNQTIREINYQEVQTILEKENGQIHF
jgi:hypothetical protein